MSFLKNRVLPASLLLFVGPSLAADFDFSLTSDSVKGQFDFTPSNSEVRLGAGYTYHEGSRHIANFDFHAQGRTALGNLPTTAGLGLRTVAWDDDDFDGGGVGVGGFATVNLPDVPGLSLTGSLHYAPSIIAFGDSDDLTNLELRVSYRAIRNAEVFGGYRYLNTDFDGPGDVNLDEGLLAGLKILF